MLPVFLHGWLREPLPPKLPLGQMLPVLFTVGCAILYCATPRYTTVGTDAARSLYTVGSAILYCATPPRYTAVGADAARSLYGRGVGRPFTVLPPYTTPRLNAARFGAMRVGVLGDPSLCYPPTPPLG